MKRKNQGPDLFAWAVARPVKPAAPASAEIVDFLEVRPTLGRWILARRTDLEIAMNDFDRRAGLMPPTPILPFKREA